jgi:hypothetical protein
MTGGRWGSLGTNPCLPFAKGRAPLALLVAIMAHPDTPHTRPPHTPQHPPDTPQHLPTPHNTPKHPTTPHTHTLPALPYTQHVQSPPAPPPTPLFLFTRVRVPPSEFRGSPVLSSSAPFSCPSSKSSSKSLETLWVSRLFLFRDSLSFETLFLKRTCSFPSRV